jgi:hypothetical protein
MTTQKKVLARLAVVIALTSLAPVVALGGDESFSSIVKHIKTNYNAKQQGFFGAMMLARFAVKIIKPAGVKNFKLALLRDLDYSRGAAPADGSFHSFIQSKIDPCWIPLVEYSAPRERQWTYVYVTREKEDIKILIITLQRQDAVVLQTKFSPEKLAEFMNNPQIMGISLNGDNRPHDSSVKSDETGSDNDGDSQKQKPAEKPPQVNQP